MNFLFNGRQSVLLVTLSIEENIRLGGWSGLSDLVESTSLIGHHYRQASCLWWRPAHLPGVDSASLSDPDQFGTDRQAACLWRRPVKPSWRRQSLTFRSIPIWEWQMTVEFVLMAGVKCWELPVCEEGRIYWVVCLFVSFYRMRFLAKSFQKTDFIFD